MENFKKYRRHFRAEQLTDIKLNETHVCKSKYELEGVILILKWLIWKGLTSIFINFFVQQIRKFSNDV